MTIEQKIALYLELEMIFGNGSGDGNIVCSAKDIVDFIDNSYIQKAPSKFPSMALDDLLDDLE